MTTNIEWTDTVWNPVTGCSAISDGCRNCYAEKIFNRLSKMPKNGGVYKGRKFMDVQAHVERLALPAAWRLPRRVFVNSMADLFHEKVPDDFLLQVFSVMVKESHHTFQVLTKRPARARVFFERFYSQSQLFPANIWMGVSIENQETADDRIETLKRLPFKTLFLSAEPLLGPVDLDFHLSKRMQAAAYPESGAIHTAVVKEDAWTEPVISWVIAGGESGPGARPAHPDWFRKIRDDCARHGVPFFMKQMTKRGRIPEDLLIREFPNAR